MSLHHLPKPIMVTADLSSFGLMVGGIVGMLPGIAALFACLWYGIQIWESKTVKRLTGREIE